MDEYVASIFRAEDAGNVTPKRRLSFNGPHAVISQKTKRFLYRESAKKVADRSVSYNSQSIS
jgi:hypothetical protein